MLRVHSGETSGDPNTLIDDGNRQQQGGSRHQISLLLSVHLSFLPWSGLWFVVGEGGNGRSLVGSGGRAGFQLPGSMGMDVGQAPTPGVEVGCGQAGCTARHPTSTRSAREPLTHPPLPSPEAGT